MASSNKVFVVKIMTPNGTVVSDMEYPPECADRLKAAIIRHAMERRSGSAPALYKPILHLRFGLVEQQVYRYPLVPKGWWRRLLKPFKRHRRAVGGIRYETFEYHDYLKNRMFKQGPVYEDSYEKSHVGI